MIKHIKSDMYVVLWVVQFSTQFVGWNNFRIKISYFIQTYLK